MSSNAQPSEGLSPNQLSSEKKRSLLAGLLRAQRSETRYTALSLAQERLWAVHALCPKSPVYNICIAYHLAGPLDIDCLEGALRTIIERHDSLRTSIVVSGGRPIQAIGLSPDKVLTRVNLSGLSASEWRTQARAQAAAEASTAFDLQHAPLVRFKLLEHCDDDHVFIVTLHHVVGDRWSLGILAQELSELYVAFRAGRPNPLSGSAPQYGEFARRQDQWFKDEVAEAQLSWWRTHLGDDVAALELPTDRHPRSVPTDRADRKTFSLPGDMVRELTAFAVGHNTTLFVVSLAALATVLWQHTGQEDLIICTPVVGRHRSSCRSIIGYFNNLLPLRIELSGGPSFAELVERVQQVTKMAYDHQDVPFQLIAKLPHPSLIPLTRCFFSVQNTHSLALDLPGIRSSYEDVANGASNFELAIFLEQQNDGVTGIVDFRSDSFSEAAVAKLVRGFQEALSRLVEEPDRPLSHSLSFRTDALSSDLASRASDSARSAQPESDAILDPLATMTKPASELERRLIEIWEEVLRVRPIDPHTSFFDLGGHSLLAAELFDRIGIAFGKELPLAMLLQAPTIEEMVRLLTDNGWSEFWSSLVPVQPRGTKPPLFFVHAGGGNVVSYRRLAQYLGEDQPVWGLQARGLHSQRRPFDRVEDMADYYLEAVRSQQKEGPYYLGGHSFGGVVAFAMAQKLVSQHQQVGGLLILDMPGPEAKARLWNSLRWHWICLSQLAWKDKVQYVSSRIGYRLRSVTKLPKPLRLAAAGLLKRKEGLAKASFRLRMLEATMKALKGYKFTTFPGRLTLFRARYGAPRIHSDPYGGWERFAARGVDVHEIPGDHMETLEEPVVRILAEKVKTCLSKAHEQCRIAPSVPIVMSDH
jgi:thioesterase domain-containing protein/acyl carrier protein